MVPQTVYDLTSILEAQGLLSTPQMASFLGSRILVARLQMALLLEYTFQMEEALAAIMASVHER